MCDLLLVAVCDRLEQLLQDLGRVLFSEVLSCDDFVEKLGALDEFLDEVNDGFVFVNFVQLDDVGVRQVLQDVDLVLETHAFLFVHLDLVEDFDGVHLPIALLGGLFDDTEGALCQLVLVQIVLLGELLEVVVLLHEVLLLRNDLVLVLVGPPFVNSYKTLPQKSRLDSLCLKALTFSEVEASVLGAFDNIQPI